MDGTRVFYVTLTNEERNKVIDTILLSYSKSPYENFWPLITKIDLMFTAGSRGDYFEAQEIRNSMLNYGLLVRLEEGPNPNDVMKITDLGREVIQAGGWIEHLKLIEEQNNADRKIKTLTISQLEGNIFQVKWWWVLVVIGAIFTKTIDKTIDWIFEILKS